MKTESEQDPLIAKAREAFIEADRTKLIRGEDAGVAVILAALREQDEKIKEQSQLISDYIGTADALAKCESDRDRMKLVNNALHDSLAFLEPEVDRLRKELEQSIKDHDLIRREGDQLRADLAALRADVDRLLKEKSEVAYAAAQAQQSLRAENERLRAEAKEAHDNGARWQAKYEAAEKVGARLSAELTEYRAMSISHNGARIEAPGCIENAFAELRAENARMREALTEAEAEAFSQRSKATGAFVQIECMRRSIKFLISSANAIVEAATTKRDGIIGSPLEIDQRAIRFEHIANLNDAARAALKGGAK